MKINKDKLKTNQKSNDSNVEPHERLRNPLSEKSPSEEIFAEDLDLDVDVKKKKVALVGVLVGLFSTVLILGVIFIGYNAFLKPKKVEPPKEMNTEVPVVQPDTDLEESDKEVIEGVADGKDTSEVIKDTPKKEEQPSNVDYTNEYIKIILKNPNKWIPEERTQEKMNEIIKATKGKRFDILKHSLKGKVAVPIVTFTTNNDTSLDSKATVFLTNSKFEKSFLPADLESKNYRQSNNTETKLDKKYKAVIKTKTKYNGKSIKEFDYTFKSYGEKYKGYNVSYKLGKNTFVFNYYSKAKNENIRKEKLDVLKLAMSLTSDSLKEKEKKEEKKKADKKAKQDAKAKDTDDSSEVDMG